eukprot:6179051-Pleurochrysis_carterae.AAC.3
MPPQNSIAGRVHHSRECCVKLQSDGRVTKTESSRRAGRECRDLGCDECGRLAGASRRSRS